MRWAAGGRHGGTKHTHAHRRRPRRRVVGCIRKVGGQSSDRKLISSQLACFGKSISAELASITEGEAAKVEEEEMKEEQKV